MRAVLDTNVIISATLIRGGNEDQILRFWQRGVFELVLSPPILEEIARAAFYEKLRKLRWMTEEEIAALLQALAQGSLMASGRIKVPPQQLTGRRWRSRPRIEERDVHLAARERLVQHGHIADHEGEEPEAHPPLDHREHAGGRGPRRHVSEPPG